MLLGGYFPVIHRECSAFITTAFQIIKLHINTLLKIQILSYTSVRSQISVRVTTIEIRKHSIQMLHIINLSYSLISFMLQSLYSWKNGSRCLTTQLYKMLKTGKVLLLQQMKSHHSINCNFTN